MEETLILPATRRLLTEEDWAEIDAAFGANRDPFILRAIPRHLSTRLRATMMQRVHLREWSGRVLSGADL